MTTMACTAAGELVECNAAKEEYEWKKVKPFDDNVENSRSSIVNNELSINYNPTDHLSVGYTNTINYDLRRKLDQELPSTDHINSITVTFRTN